MALPGDGAAKTGIIGEMTVPETVAMSQDGWRTVLLVRHAERTKIDNEDPTFGETIPLTAEGARTAEALGQMLKGVQGDVKFAASPLRRTVQTAALIAKGMGLGDVEIQEDGEIGNTSAFVSDLREMWLQFRDGRFFEKMRRWFDDGVHPGFNEIASACDEYERHALSLLGGSRFGVFATHDVFIAAYLHGRGVKTDFCERNWPRFLDSAAVFVAPDGERRYGFVRAGLSDRCRGVSAE